MGTGHRCESAPAPPPPAGPRGREPRTTRTGSPGRVASRLPSFQFQRSLSQRVRVADENVASVASTFTRKPGSSLDPTQARLGIRSHPNGGTPWRSIQVYRRGALTIVGGDPPPRCPTSPRGDLA